MSIKWMYDSPDVIIVLDISYSNIGDMLKQMCNFKEVIYSF